VDYANLLVKKEPPLGYIIINRPDKLNALNAETIKDLYSAFLSFREVSEIRVVILTGSGEKAFVAGADISELSQLSMDMPWEAEQNWLYPAIYGLLQRMPRWDSQR
jgi:enoyl-CoA hydratase